MADDLVGTAVERLRHGAGRAEVDLDQIRFGGHGLPASVREVIRHVDGITLGEERPRQVRADEPGAAGHECASIGAHRRRQPSLTGAAADTVRRMRVGYKYVPADEGGSVRTEVDSTPEEFAETMAYESGRYRSAEDFLAQHSDRWVLELHEALRDLLDKDRTVLSIGSGAGEHEALLAQEGYDIVASDIVEEAMKDAASLFPNLRVARFDVFDGAPPVAPDDVLVTGIDFYFDDAQTHRLFHRLRDITPRGGRVIFTLRYRANPATWLIDRIGLPALAAAQRVRGRRLVRKAHGFRRSERAIRAFATGAGFEVGRVRRAGYAVELERLGISSGHLTRLDRRLGILTIATVFELLRP